MKLTPRLGFEPRYPCGNKLSGILYLPGLRTTRLCDLGTTTEVIIFYFYKTIV